MRYCQFGITGRTPFIEYISMSKNLKYSLFHGFLKIAFILLFLISEVLKIGSDMGIKFAPTQKIQLESSID